MSTPIKGKALAGLWHKLSGGVPTASRRGAPPLAVVDIHCSEGAQTEELIGTLLAYAQARGLGVEHNVVKDRLVFYRDTAAPQLPQQGADPLHPNLLAFPQARSSRAYRA